MSVHTISYTSDKQLSQHFSLSEFKCSASTAMKYSDELIAMLEKIFTKCPVVAKGVVTSGYRTPAYSVQVGGSRTDAHTYGIACDIIFYDKANKVIAPKYIACVCQEIGFGGIGLIKGDRAIHLDVRHLGGYSNNKWWGDERNNYSLSAHGKDFYAYCGLSKAEVYKALGINTEEKKQEVKVMQEVRFNKFKDLPDWAKKPIGEMIDKGYFSGKSGTGDDRVIDMGEDAIRAMIVCYNMLKGGEK